MRIAATTFGWATTALGVLPEKASCAAMACATTSTTAAVAPVPVSTPLVLLNALRTLLFSAVATACPSSAWRWDTRNGASSAISVENWLRHASFSSTRSTGVIDTFASGFKSPSATTAALPAPMR